MSAAQDIAQTLAVTLWPRIEAAARADADAFARWRAAIGTPDEPAAAAVAGTARRRHRRADHRRATARRSP